MSLLQNSNAISSGGYDINNSVRLRRSASAYLQRTSSHSTQTYTYSFWMKKGPSNVSAEYIFGYYNGAGSSAGFRITSDQLEWYSYALGMNAQVLTTQVFRDPSAWYHIVGVMDTTNATSTERIRLYVNGVRITAGTFTYPSQNFNTYMGNNLAWAWGISGGSTSGSTYFDGYLTEINVIDGQALNASYFGETDTTTGVWKPKKYTGTYGTGGYYLKFSDIATTSGSNAGLGKDFSGNSNYWTTNNISVTSGTTYDAMTDSPTLTSATVANYAVLNTLDKTAGTVSNGNLTIVKGSTGAFANIRGTISVSSGKWYYETTLTSGINYSTLGILSPDVAFPSQIGDSAYGWDWYPAFAEKKNNGTSVAYGTAASAGDVIMCAFDVTNGKIWWGKNGTWFASGDPAAGTNAAFTNVTGTVAPAVAVSGTSTQLDVNFGQRPFAYTPPTGYKALNTYNLPDSTIKKGNSYMDATLYTGTRATQVVTNAAGFKPDMVWCKGRSFVSQILVSDSVRGTTKQLFTPLTVAEQTDSTMITAFNSNGFTLGDNSGGPYGNINYEIGGTHVAWQWQAGQGTTSSNTSGSITSTVSVNTTAGFSVVTYAGTLTSAGVATVGHGLGVAPKMIISKSLGTSQWVVQHTSLTSPSYFLYLNTTDAQDNKAGNGTMSAPTSTVFSTNWTTGLNVSGSNHVAYCFAEIAGFSKFGSYTGNGSADGPFIFTGFRPKFIMRKQSSGAGDWIIFDNARNPYNVETNRLLANTSNAEQSPGNNIDVLSNGWKERSSDGYSNASGQTYIYMAFAENPFKNSLAR